MPSRGRAASRGAAPTAAPDANPARGRGRGHAREARDAAGDYAESPPARAAAARGGGRGRGRPAGGAAAAAGEYDDAESDSSNPLDDDDVELEKHPYGITILSQSAVKGIKFKISRRIFRNYPAAQYNALPSRMVGEITGWGSTSLRTLEVMWAADNSGTREYLATLLNPKYDFEFLPAERTGSVPVAKGTSWKKKYADSVLPGAPYAFVVRGGPAPGADGVTDVTWDVSYKEGVTDLTQTWTLRTPQFVTVDARPGPRFRLTIKPEPRGLHPSKYKTLEGMLFHVGLCDNLLLKCVGWHNERLPPNKQTTAGELLRMWGSYAALALHPGEPVKTMWRRDARPGDLFPPPAFGLHGVTKTRWEELKPYQGLMFSKDEDDLDSSYPWRYSCAPIVCYNDTREMLIVPSWALTEDEEMALWLGDEGVVEGAGANPKPIPKTSYVERKPDPLGAEFKTVADGESGCGLRAEVQEGSPEHEKQQYFDEYGHTIATQLRMLEPYFRTTTNPSMPDRALYGDSWFTGVKSLEAIHWEVRDVCVARTVPFPTAHSSPDQSGKCLWPYGDLKTNTARFDKEKLAQHVGINSGDWATATSEVELPDGSKLQLFACAHRRGGEIHTFLCTCGCTTLGVPQRHKDDELASSDSGYILCRKCPKCCNDATLSQPKIDMNNKMRQFELAMERRFRTESWPFRCFIYFLGKMLVDTFRLHVYINKDKDLTWRAAVKRMAYAMLHNNRDKIDDGDCPATELFDTTASPFNEVSVSSTLGRLGEHAAPGRRHAKTECGHLAVPLSEVPGYSGSVQQNCAVCVANGVKTKLKTSYCCSCCASKDYILPIHQRAGKFGQPGCMAAHVADPLAHKGIRPKVKKTPVATPAPGDSPAKGTRSQARTTGSTGGSRAGGRSSRPARSQSVPASRQGRARSRLDEIDEEDEGEEEDDEDYSNLDEDSGEAQDSETGQGSEDDD